MSKLSKKRRQFIIASLIIPMLLLVAFVVFPAIDLFRMSFTNWDGYSAEKDFIWFENYISMFQNKDLWMSLKNNAVYFVIHFFMIFVELAFAVLLTGKLRAAKFYKTIVFMPYIINGVAISYAFSYFFSPINGAFDAILTTLHLESFIRSWLSDPQIVNYVLAFVSLWRFSGYHVILFMAALQSIPQDVLEAAEVDGANTWQKILHITVPGLLSTFFVLLLLAISNMLSNGFEQFWLLGNGMTWDKLEVFDTYVYRMGIKNMEYSLATAMGMFKSIVSILLLTFANWASKKLRGDSIF